MPANFPSEVARIIKSTLDDQLTNHGNFFLDYFTDDAILNYTFRIK